MSNPFPRNPAEVLIIQDELMDIKGGSIFADAVRIAAKNDLNGTLKMILSQAKDNRVVVAGVIGNRLLTQIEKL